MYKFAFGIDVHKVFLQVALCTNTEVVLQRQFGWSEESMAELRRLISEYDDAVIVMEACTGAKDLHTKLAALDVPIIVADARKFRERFPKRGRKTDAVDAMNLARFGLFGGEGVWIPSKQVCENRELAKLHVMATQSGARVRNRVQAALRENGVRPPSDRRSEWLWTKGGLEWLATQLRFVSPLLRFNLRHMLKLVADFDHTLQEVEEEMARVAEGQETIRLLMTQPGVGLVGAFLINAFVGDFKRFPTAKQLTSYAGLVPSVSQSGFKCVTGRITKRGHPQLRWIAVECGIQARQRCEELDNLHRRIKRRSGCNGKAKVAVGRKLLVRLYHMVVGNAVCKDGDPVSLKRKMRRLEWLALKSNHRLVHSTDSETGEPIPVLRRRPRAASPTKT